jgi:hypothetical protein
VPDRQLRLFAPPKPLLERFGKEFFQAVPPKPGVYLMLGRAERVLYVGQSRNLRSRLGSYKNCNPHHTPRKVQRLVHEVERILWELCEDAIEARLRENALLRQHRPKFNAVNTFPQRYFFIGLDVNETRLRLWLTTDPTPDEPLFGAFKGNTRTAFGALITLLWSYLHAPQSHHDFPLGMLSGRSPREAELQAARRDGSSLALEPFLAGTSNKLLDQLLPAILDGPPVHRALHEEALLTLAQFYESGPRRTRRLREQFETNSPLVMQDCLDDLIVLDHPSISSRRKDAHSKLSATSLPSPPTAATPAPTPAANSLPSPS